jgi:uncharacterized protein YciI
MHKTVTEEEGLIFEKHGEYLQQKFTEDIVTFAGTSFEENEDHFAIVLVNAKSKYDAKAIIDNDPAVDKGLLISHLSEFNTFLSK